MRSTLGRQVLLATAATVVTLGVAGCGATAPEAGAPRESAGRTGPTTGTPAPSGAVAGPSAAASTDEPDMDHPAEVGARPTTHADRGSPIRVIPAEAMLDEQTVGGIAGGSWAVVDAPADPCQAPVPAAAVATRTVGLRGSAGTLVHTVATHASASAGVRAVSRTADRLAGCGWERGADQMLGEASALLHRDGAGGPEVVTVIAAEGVTVTLVGSGAPVQPDAWAALADIAIGSSCPAAPDGCH